MRFRSVFAPLQMPNAHKVDPRPDDRAPHACLVTKRDWFAYSALTDRSTDFEFTKWYFTKSHGEKNGRKTCGETAFGKHRCFRAGRD